MRGYARFPMLKALLKKELIATLKERSSRMILVATLLLYVILFGYIATFNLDYVPYAVLDMDKSVASTELVRAVDASPVFERIATLENAAQITRAVDEGNALVVLAIGQDFAERLEAGESAQVQVIIDGRNSTTAQLAAGYLLAIAQAVNTRVTGVDTTAALSTRLLYNPNNITQWFIMPGLIAMLAMLQVVVLSALSVAREREQGTFEQLLVTPYRTGELLMSKALIPAAIGLFQSTLIFMVDCWWFEIPFTGTLARLYAVLCVFILSIVGYGLAISAYSKTMQQALVLVFVSLVPMVLLSGLFTPVENMPLWVQALTWFDPLRFALLAVRRVYLADAGWLDIAVTMWPAVVMAAVSLPVAYYYFKKRL